MSKHFERVLIEELDDGTLTVEFVPEVKPKKNEDHFVARERMTKTFTAKNIDEVATKIKKLTGGKVMNDFFNGGSAHNDDKEDDR